MKKPLTVFIVIAILFCLCSCGSKEPENKKQQEESQPRTTITESTTDEISSESVDEKLLEAVMPFQGEWCYIQGDERKYDDGEWHIVIKNKSMQMAYYENINDEIEDNNYEEFELIFENNSLKTKTHSSYQRQYYLTINTDEQIELSNNKNEIKNYYKKVSNKTDIPNIIHRVKPVIGMTEEQVLQSTWGSPKKRNKTTTASVISEQWVYDDGYIYLTNGIVTAIQE